MRYVHRVGSSIVRFTQSCTIAAAILLLPTQAAAEDATPPKFTVDVNSAFVWGNDTLHGAVSSIIQDPLTGRSLFRLSHSGVNVTSRMGFERVGDGRAGEFLEYATTVVNNTNESITVQYGGIIVDGYAATPPILVAEGARAANRARYDPAKIVSFSSLSCFRNGNLATEKVFSAGHLSEVFSVAPGAAFTVSSLVKDPRNYAVRCSIKGCYPTGTIRYYVRIGGHDYVFIWPGTSIAACGTKQ
jgi:hypothetical protein